MTIGASVSRRELVMTRSQTRSASTGGLVARGVVAGYGGATVLDNIDLEVVPGQIVALLGPNGAGKTTAIRVLAGLLRPADGEVLLDGATCTLPAHRRAQRGVAYVGESRHVFASLTVRQSLRLVRDREGLALAQFPELAKVLGRRAGLLSGGEQQMLAIGLALSRRPRILLVDELSLGLAPQVRDRLLTSLRAVADEGCAVLVVEQSASDLLRVADTATVLQRGRVVGTGPASEWLSQVDALGELYLR
jgi:branched-chain amino acid transport system ATP-binding protein